MAIMRYLVFATCLAAALASPPRADVQRNTIFGDERLQGEVFEATNLFNTDTATFNDDESIYRLPTTTKPLRYTIVWSLIDFETFNYTGNVIIQLYATEANVNEIVIHSLDLTIGSYSLTVGSAATNVPVTLTEQPDLEFLRFTLDSGVLAYTPQDNTIYTLTITFSGTMRTDMYGIYRSWFKTDGETKWMASTQYQATSARKAFPCYDEPSFKAYFDITIRRPQNYTSWSCTIIEETVDSVIVPGDKRTGVSPNDKKSPPLIDICDSDDITDSVIRIQKFYFRDTQEDRYYTTPYMSTYLLALIVAEYDSLSNGTGQNLTYEVIARHEAIDDGQGIYAFNVGQELLATMSEHTGIDFYSMDENLKMTQAAIPDFSAGAMENWGLLTYREAYLMYSEEHTNDYFKQLIAYILSHEIAHMWFGNLVTCDWWDVLWLNEGFARYYQYFLTHWVEEYMGLETRFITEQVHVSLLSDASNSAHPLTNPGVGSAASVSGMFSTLSYNKGASVIRMTEHLLGFNVHREGLRNYLTDYSYQTALPINLFESLQAAAVAAGAISEYGSDFSVVDYYRSWTEQAGAPVLNVQVNHQTGQMTITQRRFDINTGHSSDNTRWIVPISFATASDPNFNNTKPTHIIRDTVAVIDRGSQGDEWVILNKQQTGYYRVNYDDYTWDLIAIALRGDQRTLIHEYNRAQIVNDVFQFARSGIMSYNRAFNILSFLENEEDYAPWVAAITGFNWLRNRLVDTPLMVPINEMIANLSRNVMAELGYEAVSGESFMRSYLRWQLAPFMCNIGVQACRDEAVAQFQALRATPSVEVNANNRNWVYCNALREGSADDFNFLWQRFQEHHVYTEKIVLLQTLGCTSDMGSLYTFLNGIVEDNELIRPQDYSSAWNTAVSGNEVNTQYVFQYIQSNLTAVTRAFNGIALPLSYVSARLRTIEQVDNFQAWATSFQAELGAAYGSVYNGAESARASIAWAENVSPDLNEFLDNGVLPLETSTPTPTTTTVAVTLPQPDLIEPAVPELPSSAMSKFLSVTALVFAMVARMLA